MVYWQCIECPPLCLAMYRVPSMVSGNVWSALNGVLVMYGVPSMVPGNVWSALHGVLAMYGVPSIRGKDPSEDVIINHRTSARTTD